MPLLSRERGEGGCGERAPAHARCDVGQRAGPGHRAGGRAPRFAGSTIRTSQSLVRALAAAVTHQTCRARSGSSAGGQ